MFVPSVCSDEDDEVNERDYAMRVKRIITLLADEGVLNTVNPVSNSILVAAILDQMGKDERTPPRSIPCQDATPPAAAPAKPEQYFELTPESVKQALGDIDVNVGKQGRKIIIRKNSSLEDLDFTFVNDFVKGQGGQWVPAGRDSRWEI